MSSVQVLIWDHDQARIEEWINPLQAWSDGTWIKTWVNEDMASRDIQGAKDHPHGPVQTKPVPEPKKQPGEGLTDEQRRVLGTSWNGTSKGVGGVKLG